EAPKPPEPKAIPKEEIPRTGAEIRERLVAAAAQADALEGSVGGFSDALKASFREAKNKGIPVAINKTRDGGVSVTIAGKYRVEFDDARMRSGIVRYGDDFEKLASFGEKEKAPQGGKGDPSPEE